MSWAKLDDKANEHVKQLRAGSEACWLWACGLMYANRQPERDGFIPREALSILYGPARNPKRLAERLVEVGLWDRVDGGFRIHNYHRWNPTQAQIDEERAKGRERASASYARKHPKSSPEELPKTSKSSPEDTSEDETKKHDSSGSTRVDPLRLHSDSTPTPEDPPVGPPAGGKRSKGTRTVKRQLPDDWAPSETHRAEAKSLGVSCDGEAQKFRDYCQANGRGYADFEAAFRNWLRRSKDFGPRGGAKGSTSTDIAFRRVRELEDMELTERDRRDLDSVFGGVGT